MQTEAMDPEFVSQLLPLGDAVVGATVTLLTALFTYLVGRRQSNAIVDNLKAEKRSIEAASHVSTAEAAQIISEAAAATVQPLVERVREQGQLIKEMSAQATEDRVTINKLRTELAEAKAEHELMKRQMTLQGEILTEINNLPEV